MALLEQFRQAENKTGSFDETAGYRSCRSPLKLCSMWSLRVTNFAQQVRRRSGWRVVRGVDQKRLKIMSTADSVQYRDLLRCTILWSHRTSSVPTQINWNRQIPCARQGKTVAFRSRLGNWIMNSPCDNWRPVGRLEADTWWPETQFLSYSSVTKRLIRVLFCMLGMRVGMTVWCTLILWHWDWCLCPTTCSLTIFQLPIIHSVCPPNFA